MERFDIGCAHDIFAVPLRDKIIVGTSFDTGNWHTHLSFRFQDGNTIRFASREHCLAPFFDCYTLSVTSVLDAADSMISMTPHFNVEHIAALRRDEWLAPAPQFDGLTVGNAPQAQRSGMPGTAPDDARVSAVLIAGVLLYSTDGRRVAIVTSETVPLKVELVSEATDIDGLLERHEIVRGNSGAVPGPSRSSGR